MIDDDEHDSASTFSFRYKYDIFLSFRGEDTRHNFTHRLYNNLIQNGVRTFRDDDELERGEEIAPSLVEGIQDSAGAICVISRRYADSRWCLEELAMIVESRKLLLPVFYEVDPSDVRRQKGPFEKDFQLLEERFGAEKVVRWRHCLEKAGSVAGWDSKLWKKEDDLIQSLVKRVLAKLSNIPLGVAKYPVGLNSSLEQLMTIMDAKANGVKFLVIHGMGGAGKTTLARALYNKLVIYFKRRSFISNVRETSREKDGLTILQNKLTGDLSRRETLGTSKDILKIRKLIQEEPVLIILDDIDDSKQLQDLIGNNRQWFYEGSRIIITTRNKEAIPESVVDAFYEVEKLKFPDAVELFSYHAFGRGKPTKDLVDLSEKIVNLTGGLPLALEVFGSLFYDKRRRKDWIEALKKLEQVRPGELQDVLKISFDSLDQQEKCAFLDIACFFVDMKMKREDVVCILKGYGFSGETLIRTLVAKSLTKIIEADTLWMHDQLKDMGKQIVQDENSDIGMRSRLWDHNDILNVLKNNKGTRSVEGIALDIGKTQRDFSNNDTPLENFRKRTPFSSSYWKKAFKTNFHQKSENKKDVLLHAKSFKPMVNLRFLKIDDVQLEGSYKLMPAELKCLQWKKCSLNALPSEFRLQHLAVLDLSESKIERPFKKSFCNLQSSNNRGRKLVVMNLQGCQHLTYLPDFSFHPDLERLNLELCKALVKLHPSVGDLKKLHYLNLNACENLVEFPSDVSGLKHLEILVLSGCSKLKELPDDLKSMGCLREFLIDGTAINKLPDSIFHLKKLEVFSLRGCRSLKQLPPSIGTLNSLKELHLDGSGLEEIPSSIVSLTELEMLTLVGCKALTALPDAIGDLKSLLKLFLDRSAITELPTSIGLLSHLKHLSVGGCRSLTKLPDAIGGLASLIVFSLEGSSVTEIPDNISSCSMIEKLSMSGCTFIRVLSESVGNLLSITNLVLDKVMITELPESIGRLERLITLRLNECKQLQRLPASIGNLKNLCNFEMKLTSVSELPDELGMLSSLKILKLGKKSYALSPPNSGELVLAEASTSQRKFIPKFFSNLSSLQELDICAWQFCGGISDDFEKLSSMEKLNLSYNNFVSLPSSLRGLSILKKLNLSHCKEIKNLPLVPSSLVDLNCAHCSELESISDLRNLTSLRDLNLTNCNKIIDIPGLECLKSLRSLNMGGCNTCFPRVKERLAKVALKHLYYLSIPGSTIPDWFVPELPRFATPRNRDIKSIIVAVVISLDQQTTDPFREKLPAIVDIKLAYYKQDDPNPEFSRILNLTGVPKTNEDHLYLCRFYEFHAPVLSLKDGYRIQLSMREPPCFKGLTLKKYGFHFIFENDDFDEEDEELLEESQRSVSWKLAKFIGSLHTD